MNIRRSLFAVAAIAVSFAIASTAMADRKCRCVQCCPPGERPIVVHVCNDSGGNGDNDSVQPESGIDATNTPVIQYNPAMSFGYAPAPMFMPYPVFAGQFNGFGQSESGVDSSEFSSQLLEIANRLNKVDQNLEELTRIVDDHGRAIERITEILQYGKFQYEYEGGQAEDVDFQGLLDKLNGEND